MLGVLTLWGFLKKRDYADFVLMAASVVPVVFLLVASGKGIWNLFTQ